MIHTTAIIHETAKLGSNVTIGPYSCIGKNVEIGANSILLNSVNVECNTKLGEAVKIYPFASVGAAPQDLSYKGEETFLEIGAGTVVRENVTISRGTMKEKGLTKVGMNCLLMAGAHIGHDSIIGNNVVIANYAGITGHVHIQDHVIFGGLAGVHQFVTIGEGAIVSGGAMCVQDIFPFTNAQGDRASIRGLNIVGLKRRSFDEKRIRAIKQAYKYYFLDELSHEEALLKIEDLYKNENLRELSLIVDFLKNTKRGLARTPKYNKDETAE